MIPRQVFEARLRDLVVRRALVWIDVEASGLGPGTWPIEVGIARIVDGQVVSEGRLIRPEPDCDTGCWSAQSAEVHGIPLERLYHKGERACDVAAWMVAETGGMAVSDAPEFDRRWLGRLLLLLDPEPGLLLVDFDLAASAVSGGVIGRLRRIYQHIDAHPAPHRAAADAALLTRAWLAGGGRITAKSN